MVCDTPVMVLDIFLFNTQSYKKQIKVSGTIYGKELFNPLRLGVVVIKKGTFGSP